MDHDHKSHSTKCLRGSARIIGFELHDIYHWTYSALAWLSQFGRVSVLGTAELGWTVTIENPTEGADDLWSFADISVCSGGHTMTEAICGAVYAVDAALTKEPTDG